MKATIRRFEVLRRLIADRGGATAIEYGLIASSVSIVIVTVVYQIGDNMKILFYDKLAAMF